MHSHNLSNYHLESTLPKQECILKIGQVIYILQITVGSLECTMSLLFTGSTQAFTRKEIWGSKRVHFLTPQVMVNDLSRGACPAAEIKCLVIDEAHKALGNYAYCQVILLKSIL